jgi:serine/threonine protein kinase/tetratricopeptide (TPR) repeat protein
MHDDDQNLFDGDSDVFQKGAVVFGQFEIIRFIAAGGKGRVYQARDTLRDVSVALKVMLRNVSGTDVMRFQKEAKLASKLDHPNIVGIYDFKIEDNTPFLVMEYVEGRTLQEILDEDKVLDADAFAQIFEQITKALMYAHARGIVHRDIKPSNITISISDGGKPTAKILDFGIATDVLNDGTAGQLTVHKAIVGSPLYLSPEQSRGEQVSTSSDAYSLGCVMWHAATGKPPYEADSVMEVLVLHQNSNPVELKDPEHISGELLNSMRRLLSKDPGERPALGILLHDLEQFEQMQADKRTEAKVQLLDTTSGELKKAQYSTRQFVIGALLLAFWVGIFIFKNFFMDKPIASVTTGGKVGPVVLMNAKTKEGHDAVVDHINEKIAGGAHVTDDGKRLYLRDRSIEQIERFEKNPWPVEIYISNCDEISDRQFQSIMRFPLIRLLFVDCALTHLPDLSKLKRMNTLDLRHCTINDTVLDNISNLDAVTHLSLTRTKLATIPIVNSMAEEHQSGSITSGGTPTDRFPSVDSLRRMKNLQIVNVSNSSISDDQLLTLCSMPSIEGVDFRGCTNVTLTLVTLRKRFPLISFNGKYSYLHDASIHMHKIKSSLPVDFSRLLGAATRTIAVVSERCGADAPELEGIYMDGAHAAVGLRDWSISENMALRALKISEAVNDELVEISALDVLARSYLQTNQIKKARTTINRLLALTEKSKGKDSLEVALVLKELALCDKYSSDQKSAVRNLQKIIDIYSKAGDLKSAASERVSIAEAYAFSNRIELAERECNAALAFAKSLPPGIKKDTLTVSGYTVMATIKRLSGNYSEALKLNAEAFAQSRNLPAAVEVSNNLEAQKKLILAEQRQRKSR